MTRFSSRLPASFESNAWSRARAALGRDAIDWTVSNPELASIFDEPLLRRTETLLRSASPGPYRPEPCGRVEAREAVARLYDARGAPVHPDDVVLTASTSEAYGLLFRVLCDPGDPVAVPRPSYPLFEHLARLEGVRPVDAPLDPSAGWRPDPSYPDETARLRLLVHPNNPTGTFADGPAMEALRERAVRDGESWIVDEVFLEYPHDVDGANADGSADPPPPRTYAAERDLPCVALGGLSKRLGLPGTKLAWIVIAGPKPFRDALRERLEFAADQYLSVGDAIQRALPALLAGADERRERVHARVLDNVTRVRAWTAGRPQVDRIAGDGGWSACVRLPRVRDDETRSLDLMQRHGVVTQPGYLFDFPDAGWLVVSLLAPPAVSERGLRALDDELERDP